MAYNGHIIKEANVVGYDKKDFNPLALDGIFCINDWDTASSLFSSFCSSEERIKLALKVGDQLDCMGYLNAILFEGAGRQKMLFLKNICIEPEIRYKHAATYLVYKTLLLADEYNIEKVGAFPNPPEHVFPKEECKKWLRKFSFGISGNRHIELVSSETQFLGRRDT